MQERPEARARDGEWRDGVRRDVERAVSHAQELERAVSTVAKGLRSPEETAAALIEHALANLGANAAWALRLMEGGRELELYGAANLAVDVAAMIRRVPLTAPSPLAVAVRTNTPVVLGSPAQGAERFPGVVDLMRRIGAETLIAVPVRHLGIVQGAFALTFPDQRRLPETERRRLTILGSRYARALFHARLYLAERAAHGEADVARAEAERARREAEMARAEAEEANRAKSDFIAVVSHELRTPLSAIMGYTELLADEVAGPVSEHQREYLNRLRDSGIHLLRVIDDLLGFARIEARKEQLSVQRFELRPVLDAAAMTVAPVLQRKRLEFHAECVPAQVVMESDQRKVRQVLLNLLGNAVKFTERGGIMVSARGHPAHVEIRISDTGIGISAPDLERLFDPFWQAARKTVHAEPGTGLGLSIARSYARLLGGDLTAASTPGEGSTFVLSLPLRVPTRA